MPVPETRARRSKATFCWTLFRFLRKQNHNVPRPTNATNPIPPTTPPAIAPALDFELRADEELPVDVGLADVGLVDAVPDEVNELEILVPVVTADEVVKVALAFCSAANTLKLLFVWVTSRKAHKGTTTAGGRDAGNVVKDTAGQFRLHVSQSI